MKWILLFFFSGIFFFAGTLYFRLGAYKDPDFQLNPKKQSFQFLYKEHTGSYYKVNSTISTVEKWAEKNNIPCDRTFGEYLDDPQTKEEARLRSNVGCLVSQNLGEDIPSDFHYENRPTQLYISARFDGSPSLGPFKVYPKMMEWIHSNGRELSGAIIEVYSLFGKDRVQTEYFFPIK